MQPAPVFSLTLPKSGQQFYLLRHGQTDFNAQNIVQGGGVDSSLNDTGRAQAASFFERYQGVPFAGVYSSGLKRTAETLAGFAAAGYSITPLSGLNEISWGEIEGKPQNEAVEAIFHQAVNEWERGNLGFAIAGGESPLAAAERLQAAFETILQEHPEGNILICTHGRVMRILLCLLLGYALSEMQLFSHRNTALNLFVRTGSRFYLSRLNDLGHLSLS